MLLLLARLGLSPFLSPQACISDREGGGGWEVGAKERAQKQSWGFEVVWKTLSRQIKEKEREWARNGRLIKPL